MADSYKDIIITPNRSQTSDPKIEFRGANTASNVAITATMYPDANGTLSFDGSAGQLFSITNDLTGSLFSVNDISGFPSLEVFANGAVRIAEFGGNLRINNYTMPSADGTAGQAITTNGNGVLSFTTLAGDIESVTAGSGLTGGGTAGNITLDVGAGAGITVNADNVAVNSAFVRNLISVTDSGGMGNIVYDSSTGVINYTGPQFTFGNTTPSNASVGDQWVHSDTGKKYTYVDDGTSSQWVEFGLAGSSSIPFFIQPDQPTSSGPYMWIQTGLGALGDEYTIWVNTGV